MKQSNPQNFLDVATDLAKKAAAEIAKLLKTPTVQYQKADHSLCTEADLKSDELILTGLRQNFPDHAILSEETGLSGNPRSEFVWMVDPLDGTKAFAKGIPGFCVMVGLVKEDEPHLGVVVDPLEGHIYQGIRGQGAFHIQKGRREALRVSSRRDFSQMPIALSPNFPEEALRKIQEELKGPLLEPIHSVGIKAGLLLRQIGDLYLNHHPVSYWDTCAPKIILEEAGGLMTRWEGSALTYELTPPYAHEGLTFASNGTRHLDVVEILTKISLSQVAG